MVEYLSGNRIQGISAKITTPSQTSWKELGRTTLSSTGDSINVASFSAKDNLMILTHGIESGVIIPSYQFNGDTNNNYIIRGSINGGGDFTGNAANKMQWSNAGTADTNFGVGQIVNVAAQEKLAIISSVKSDTGASNAPNREETVGKWANTSNQITTVNVMNTQSGDFASGSEVVVLGYDNDEADSGTNFWQELASVTASGSSGTLDSGTFTAKKYLMIEAYGVTGGSNMDNMGWRVNSDSGNNYARKVSHNGGSDSTATSQSFIRFGSGSPAGNDLHISTFIINKSDKEKLFINECNRNRSTGAGNVPDRFENVGKWSNTSSQITSIQLITDTSNWTTNSYIKVYGAD